MTIEKVMEKVRRMLAIAARENTNPHEAAVAATKAQELMFQYHLKSEDIIHDGGARPKAEIDFALFYYASFNKTHETWREALLKAVGDNNFAQVILTGPKDMRSCVIVAREVDIEYFKYLYVYLSETIERLAISTRQAEGLHIPKVKWDDAFCAGAVHSIRITMEEQRRADMNRDGGMALVLRSDKDVEEKFNELYPKQIMPRSRKRNINSHALAAGLREGAKVAINKVINSKKTQEIGE